MKCLNHRCKEPCIGFFCPSCAYMGRLGMFAGGLIVGAIVAFVKVWNAHPVSP